MSSSSSSEEKSVLETSVSQEATDKIVSPTSRGKESVDNRLGCKRKKLDALVEVFAADSASLNNKRCRANFQPSNSSPTGSGLRGAPHYKKGGRSDVVETGEKRRTRLNKNLQSSGLSRSVSPPSHPTEGIKVISGRNSPLRAAEAYSALGSGLANQSTVTTSSTKEDEGTSLHKFGQTSKVARETKGKLHQISSLETLGTGGIASRQTGTHDQHGKRGKHAIVNHTQGSRMKLRIHNPQPDGEVLSPISKFFADITSHAEEVDRVFGSTVRDVSYGERSGRTETTCVLNSECSSVEAGRGERSTEYGRWVGQSDDSSEFVHSSCTRELHSISIGPGVCLSSGSDSIPSALVPYQPYRPMQPSRMKGSVVSLCQTNSVIVTAKGTFTTEKYKGQNSEVTPGSSHAPSHAGSSNASEQETDSSSSPTLESKFCGGDAVRVDGVRNLGPTFVLSSGRMSQDEAKKLGLRPSTIDDDFDDYFSQLML